jgi:hypothetical protein
LRTAPTGDQEVQEGQEKFTREKEIRRKTTFWGSDQIDHGTFDHSPRKWFLPVSLSLVSFS